MRCSGRLTGVLTVLPYSKVCTLHRFRNNGLGWMYSLPDANLQTRTSLGLSKKNLAVKPSGLERFWGLTEWQNTVTPRLAVGSGHVQTQSRSARLVITRHPLACDFRIAAGGTLT